MTSGAGRPCSWSLRLPIFGLAFAFVISLSGCAQLTLNPAALSGPSAKAAAPRLVAYLPDYHSSYSGYAQTINFTGITHLILAFGHAPVCNGVCTAASDMTISLRQSDAEIAAIVTAAHNAGVKVLISSAAATIPETRPSASSTTSASPPHSPRRSTTLSPHTTSTASTSTLKMKPTWARRSATLSPLSLPACILKASSSPAPSPSTASPS